MGLITAVVLLGVLVAAAGGQREHQQSAGQQEPKLSFSWVDLLLQGGCFAIPRCYCLPAGKSYQRKFPAGCFFTWETKYPLHFVQSCDI